MTTPSGAHLRELQDLLMESGPPTSMWSQVNLTQTQRPLQAESLWPLLDTGRASLLFSLYLDLMCSECHVLAPKHFMVTESRKPKQTH